MKHRFDKLPIPAGAKSVVETCRWCPQTRTHYANGGVVYPAGKTLECPGDPSRQKEEVPASPSYEMMATVEDKAPVPTVRKATMESPVQFSQPNPWEQPKTFRTLSAVEEQLHQAKSLIRRMHDDYVRRGIMSPERIEAGKFLYNNL